MKILVTGALGHIGSKLIRVLPTKFKNCKIVLIDNLMTQRYCSLFNLPCNGRYHFIEGDITKLKLLQLLKDCSHVIHLAAITDAASSFGRKKEILKNNFTGTKKIVNACRKTKSKLIYISSTSVYGSQESVVFEDCNKKNLNPQSPYAESKIKEECYIKKTLQNKKYTIFRFGTIVGKSPGMRFHTAVNKFCWQAVHQQPITVWKSAINQNRPYLHLNDGIKIILKCIKQNLFRNQTVNVVSENLTVAKILKNVKKINPSIEIKQTKNPLLNQFSYKVKSNFTKKYYPSKMTFIKKGIFETLNLLKLK